ncbi:BatA domain-containing protein [Rufibacter sediminis]|uniref:BatA domain-containing protein n=1 Tax=Rufibacter sediminis TaxID=2762756 RepID=A0ABR6VVC9_9BACT|nr:BatA domain-containing protein [Rufibacter sediminis]MBC3540758.1 BatA domain-containing protein [Rufibacter sediminis]
MLPLISGTAIAATLLIFIHFFGLRLRQKLDFSHIQFLTALISKTKSVRRINNYLLLFLRLLFVTAALGAFLLFLFQSKKNLGTSAAETSVILDNSWSMQSSSLEKGRTKAEEAVSAARGISSGNSVQSNQIVATDSLSLPESPTSFVSAQELIEGITEKSRSTTTYLFSDFQKSGYPVEVLKTFPKNQAITLVSMANSQTPNLYIDSVWLEQPVLMPESMADIAVRVVGSLLDKSNQVKITAAEGEQLLGATQVLLDPGQKAVAHFKIPLTKKEARPITFSVDDPETTFDNQYYIVLPEPSSINIKVNRSLAGKDPVVQAYRAEPAFTFSKEVTSGSGLWILDIPAGGATAALATQVKNWVENGGSVLLIPGATLQQSSLSFLSSIGLRGISEESKEVGAKPLKQPDLSDSFFRQIFEKEVKNMKMPEATPVLRWQSSFHTILRFTDNAPFLSTFKVGNGNIHLFASPVTNASSLVAHPLFVPVLYQLALSTDNAKTVLSHQPASGSIALPIRNEATSKNPYALRMGNQTFIPDQRVRQDQLFMTLPKDVSKPGFYQLVRDGKILGQLALNVPRAESRLESYSVNELKEILADHGANVQVIEPKERVSLQKQLQNEASNSSLWKYCLILCFLCLVMEAVILSTKKSGSPI